MTERYKKTNFLIASKYKYKNIFGKNVKLFCGILFNLINKFIQVITLKNYSLIKLLIKFSKYIVWIGGSIFIESCKSDHITISMPKNRKYYILGSNFGPYKTEKYLNSAINTFSNAKDVCFRENYSYEQFKILPNVRKAPDLVFSLNTKDIKIINSKKVIISIINCKKRFSKEINKKYEEKIIELCDFFIKHKYEIILMSYCKFEGDEKAIKTIMNKFLNNKKNISTYFYRGNINEALNIMGDCQIVVGSRFHANILGLLLNKTVIPIIYSKKTKNFLEDINFKGKYIDIESLGDFRINEFSEQDLNYVYDNKNLILNSKKHFEVLDKELI